MLRPCTSSEQTQFLAERAFELRAHDFVIREKLDGIRFGSTFDIRFFCFLNLDGATDELFGLGGDWAGSGSRITHTLACLLESCNQGFCARVVFSKPALGQKITDGAMSPEECAEFFFDVCVLGCELNRNTRGFGVLE